MEFHIINIKRRQKMISKNAINKTIKELTKKYPHQKRKNKNRSKSSFKTMAEF